MYPTWMDDLETSIIPKKESQMAQNVLAGASQGSRFY